MRYVGLAFTVAAVIFGLSWLGIQRFPRKVTEIATQGIIERAGTANRFHHERLADENWRTIVRPSPELMYSAMALDLREGPIAITFPAHAEYWSAQFIDPETSTFADVGYEDGITTGATIVVALRDRQTVDPSARVVWSEHSRGFVLLRYLVSKPSEASRIDSIRRKTSVSSIRDR